MPLTVIRGQYRIEHTEPDGDSVRFYPTDPQAFRTAGIAARVGAGGGVQLRLDAIDALETHYSPRTAGGSPLHQPLRYGHAAGARLLHLLGFSHVQRDGERVTAATPERTDGHILTRFADKYGRPVAFAYAGPAAEADLAQVHLDPDRLRGSTNYQLAAAGLVYPTYYSKLYPDLRGALSAAVGAARARQSGLWAHDATNSGAKITDAGVLTDQAVLLPKLFRRLVDYLALGHGDVSLAGFADYLAVQDDRLFVLSTGHATGLDTLVAVDQQTVRLTNPPEDLVFIEA